MSEDVLGLISAIPEPARPYALLALEVMLLAAGASPLLKWWLGEPQPGKDPRWKRGLYALATALDWLAVNSTPMREKVRRARAALPRARHSVPPGPR